MTTTTRPTLARVQVRVLDLFSRRGTAMTVREIEYALGLDGPSERSIRIAMMDLIESGKLVASGERVRPETEGE